jgi:hypothetical protein
MLAMAGSIQNNKLKKVDTNQAISLLANLGVIAGIVFLAVEIRQNSALMRIQINQARADAAMLSNEQSFNSDYIPLILEKLRVGEQLDPVEWARYVDYFRAMNRNQDNVLSQWEAGMLDDNTPRSVATYACTVVGSTEESREAWEITKAGYTNSYISFIENALTDCD